MVEGCLIQNMGPLLLLEILLLENKVWSLTLSLFKMLENIHRIIDFLELKSTSEALNSPAMNSTTGSGGPGPYPNYT